VLDHSLDHLNQIEQWRRWRRHGVVPTPTDGWVGSTVTLPEDPVARYAAADARLAECLAAAGERAGDPAVVFPDPYGTFFTPSGVVAEVVALEHELLSQTT